MGIGDSYLDNISKGGLFVGIDIENETLKEVAYTTIAEGYCKTFLSHPDSGITFKGFKIPFYDKAKEAKELLIEINNRLDKLVTGIKVRANNL